jgi:hypothetical protein
LACLLFFFFTLKNTRQIKSYIEEHQINQSRILKNTRQIKSRTLNNIRQTKSRILKNTRQTKSRTLNVWLVLSVGFQCMSFGLSGVL